MKSIYDKVNIFLSNQCNAQCEICCRRSGPQETKHCLSPEIVEKVIRDTAEMPGMERVNFSGGEVWLRREEVLSYIRLATSLGLRSTLYTNGFWGKDAGAARDCVAQMAEAGLEKVSFSADKYHQKYIPPEHLKHAMEAVLEAGLKCEVSVMEFADCGTLAWVKEALGEKLLQPPVKTLRHPAIPAGRAKETLKHDDFYRPIVTWMCCCFHMGYLQLAEDGSWIACCGISSTDIPELCVGNVRDVPLREVEAHAMSNDFLKIILLDGWSWLFTKAKERGDPLPESVSMPCECCSYFFSHPQLMEELKEEAREYAAGLKGKE